MTICLVADISGGTAPMPFSRAWASFSVYSRSFDLAAASVPKGRSTMSNVYAAIPQAALREIKKKDIDDAVGEPAVKPEIWTEKTRKQNIYIFVHISSWNRYTDYVNSGVKKKNKKKKEEEEEEEETKKKKK